ncbi:MAG: undecaprenyl-diphosphatase UppP [Candidatus Cloacimonetes bacterium]|nr:undecaprenyl-diphosphatase UppP [Candidatus Cloacimonadota bacterium]
MTAIKAIILGVIQGLTEFLPVSSSGHLVIFQKLLRFNDPGVLFEIAVHLGTLVAVIIFFRKDIWEIIQSLFNWRKDAPENIKYAHHLLLYLFIASAITAIIGFKFKDTFEALFENTVLVGFMLIITGGVLFASDKIKNTTKIKMSVSSSLLVGLAQSIAIIPGISRSGATITTGIFTGRTRNLATRFSFLLSIPAILGATLLKLKDLQSAVSSGAMGLNFILGGIFAAIVGYFAIAFLIKMIKKANLFYFSIYCWILGLFTIFFI